jgi:hypothetical protein
MGFDAAAGPRVWALALLIVAMGCAPLPMQAQAQAGRFIYSCVLNGKTITRDRVIAECINVEQRQLNPDGSLNRIIPPSQSAEEKANQEECEREAGVIESDRRELVRRDRTLMTQFPNEARHKLAREKALDDSRKAVRLSEERIKLLQIERKPMLDEAEFYVGKPLPAKLKQQLDNNDASLEAQKALGQNQQSEFVRINGVFDLQLARLKKLWAGVAPGSLGPSGGQAPVIAAASTPSTKCHTAAPRK